MARPEAKIDLPELEKLCTMQCTDEEIAAFFGVSSRTIVRRRQVKKFNEIMERGVMTRVNRIAPPHATVLAYEVQARYLLRDDLRLLSVNGITDGKVAPYRPKRDMTGFLQRYRPGYWIANDVVKTLPYTRASILDTVIRTYESNPRQRTLGAGGIRFELVARRSHPPPAGFAGWLFLFKLHYR